jgi:hypothetical protein
MSELAESDDWIEEHFERPDYYDFIEASLSLTTCLDSVRQIYTNGLDKDWISRPISILHGQRGQASFLPSEALSWFVANRNVPVQCGDLFWNSYHEASFHVVDSFLRRASSGIDAIRDDPLYQPHFINSLKAGLEHERVKYLKYEVYRPKPDDGNAGAEQANTLEAKRIEFLLREVFGPNVTKLLATFRSDKGVDEKMREICGIDYIALEWNSPTWANLLGVTGGMVRKTQFWKEDRRKAIEARRR